MTCEAGSPYLPFTVEEVACIQSLDQWANCRARVVGRVLAIDLGTSRGRLASVGEGVAAIIRICFRAVPDQAGQLGRGAVVQLLGQLDMFRGDPILRVHIVRPMPGLDTEAYYRAVCRIQSHLPCNIRRPSS